MRLPDGPVTWPGDKDVGRYFLDLSRERQWALRRVETISFLDERRVERKVSLDVDLELLREAAVRAALIPESSDDLGETLLPVPIVLLAKGTLVDLDVSDANGRSLSVALSSVDSAVASALLCALLDENSLLNTAHIRDLVYAIANDETESTLADLVRFIEGGQPTATGSGPQEADRAAWRSIADNPEAADFLSQFATRFMLICQLAYEPRVVTVKYRYVETTKPPDRRRFWDRLGVGSMPLQVSVPGLGYARSEHIRVDAPPGATIEDPTLSRETATTSGSTFAVTASKDRYRSRPTLDRAVFHTRVATGGDYRVSLAVRSEPNVFYHPALLASALGLLLFGFGAALDVANVLSGTNLEINSDAAVAVLAISISLLAVYAAVGSEHGLISRLLFWPRLFVAISAAVGLLAAGAVVIDSELRWLFLCSGAIYNLLLVGLLIAGLTTSAVSRRETQRLNEREVEIVDEPES